MEIKINCPCGTRYKFDVEPFGGRMPGPVACPTCQADGTATAQAIMDMQLGDSASATPPVGKTVRITGPAPQPPPEAANITREDVDKFRRKELPELQDFIKGKPSQKDFEANFESEVQSTLSVWQFFTAKNAVFTLLWVVLGTGSAFRIASSTKKSAGTGPARTQLCFRGLSGRSL